MKSSPWSSRALGALAVSLAAALAHPSVALSAGRPVPVASAADKAGAQKAYLAAMEHYKAKRLDEALAGFRASYDIVASPNSHMMVVNTLVDLGRRVEAYEEAQAVAVEADALGESYASAAKAARDMMADLTPRIALITVTIVKEATPIALRVGGRTTPEARWREPIPAAPGPVEVSLQMASGTDTQTISVAEGATGSVELGAPKAAPVAALSKEEEPSGDKPDILRIAGLAAASVGVIGIVSFNILGAVNNATFSDLEDRCANNVCPEDASGDVTSGQRLQTAANVMLAVGILGAAAGTGLLTYSFTQGDQGDAASPAVSLTLSPQAAVLSGSF